MWKKQYIDTIKKNGKDAGVLKHLIDRTICVRMDMQNRLRVMKRIFFILLLLVLPVLGSAIGALAEETPADEVKVNTPLYFPAENLNFREGTFFYEVAWEGIPAAQAEVSVRERNGLYEVYLSAKTNSFVDVFYKLRYAAAGSLSSEDYSPGYLFIDQRENSRITKASLEFSDDGRIRSQLSKKKSSGLRFEEFNFDSENFTLEPLSAAFLARSLDWEPGVERSFDTFDGKSRYLISLKCIKETTVTINGSERPVWVVEPKVTNLGKNEKSKKLRKAYLYVTADKYRDVLQLESEVFVGSVTTKLTKFVPSARPSLQVAQNLVQK